MREIRFRAWDEKNQAMIYPKGILFDGRVVNFMCGMLEPFDGYKLMQYTGLKDKNGKEIYEGDILRHTVDYGPGGEWERVTAIQLTPFGINVQPWIFCEEGYLPEIIGNIWENPELLKGEETA